jgi:glucose-1-phosphatase
MNQISLVLFDLGNVLAYIDFNEFWRTLGLVHSEEIAPFASGYKSWTRQYETGFVSTSEYLSGLQSVFGRRFNVKQLKQAFENIIQEPVDGMLDIVKHVSQEHGTALVSDTNEIHYRLSLKKLVVLNILQKHYLSYQLRVMKPARGFYDAIIKDQEIDPSNLLFIDDLEENVKAAKIAGMQAVKFKGVEKLEVDLKTFNVF